MEKIFGTDQRHDSLIVHGTKKTVLIYGYGEENGQGYDFRHVFDHIPTKEEVIAVIHDQVNAETDRTILTGYQWEGKNVWLSSENQFNFKAAFDVAVQTQGASLPVKFKLGEDEMGVPVYHTFEDMEGFTDFYTKAITFIMTALNEGWAEKDAALQWVETLDLNSGEE
jgi:hypothetical protein